MRIGGRTGHRLRRRCPRLCRHSRPRQPRRPRRSDVFPTPDKWTLSRRLDVSPTSGRRVGHRQDVQSSVRHPFVGPAARPPCQRPVAFQRLPVDADRSDRFLGATRPNRDSRQGSLSRTGSPGGSQFRPELTRAPKLHDTRSVLGKHSAKMHSAENRSGQTRLSEIHRSRNQRARHYRTRTRNRRERLRRGGARVRGGRRRARSVPAHTRGPGCRP